MGEKLVIVIPAYNEHETIESVVREWYEVVEKVGNGSLLVVFNDGSKDNTSEILHSIEKEMVNFRVIDKANSGHGATCVFGYKWAIENGADWIFQTDSDGQTRASEFMDFWKKRNKHVVLMGKRPNRKDGISRVIVSRGLRFILNSIYGMDIIDSNVPYRLMKKEVLERSLRYMPEDSFLCNVMLSIIMFYKKEDIVFYPITFEPRKGGESFINIKSIYNIAVKTIKDAIKLKKSLKSE